MMVKICKTFETSDAFTSAGHLIGLIVQVSSKEVIDVSAVQSVETSIFGEVIWESDGRLFLMSGLSLNMDGGGFFFIWMHASGVSYSQKEGVLFSQL